MRKSVNGGRLYTWKVRKGWLLTSTIASMFSAAEFPPPSVSLPCWFLLLAVSGLFYLTRKRCKIHHIIWLGIEQIGCSSHIVHSRAHVCVLAVILNPIPFFKKKLSQRDWETYIFRPSRREVENDVWKYLQDITIGLYAVSHQNLAHPDRDLKPLSNSC